MPSQLLIVTGTDTGVGKTIVTAALAAALGRRVAVVKPAQTGSDSDVDTVAHLAAPALCMTLASFPYPLAPLAAARVAGLDPLDLYAVADSIKEIAASHELTLVEGAGGLLVPMGLRSVSPAPQPFGPTPLGDSPWTIADLAVTLDASAIVVVRAGLGTLNHTALTLEALERRGIPARVVIGAWPTHPELVHFTNLDDLPGDLHGLLPEGAGTLPPGVFRRSAPGWLTPELHGTCDDPRELASPSDE